jgi:hypothetical protein
VPGGESRFRAPGVVGRASSMKRDTIVQLPGLVGRADSCFDGCVTDQGSVLPALYPDAHLSVVVIGERRVQYSPC